MEVSINFDDLCAENHYQFKELLGPSLILYIAISIERIIKKAFIQTDDDIDENDLEYKMIKQIFMDFNYKMHKAIL